MSTVWGTRYRLLLEQLEQQADRLRADRPRSPRAAEEQTVRLLMCVAQLLQQHRVDERGRCRSCRWPRRSWFGGRLRCRRRCAVYQALDFATGQPLDVVWWQLGESAGRNMTLVQTRTWLAQREQATGEVGERDADSDTVVLERRNE